VEPEPSFVLEFSTGQVVTVTGRGVIGRAPRDAGDDASLQLVTVDDPGRSVSKVHARFDVDAHGLWIEDLGSGNGTVVVQPGGSPVAVHPGGRTPVGVGAVVRLGRQSFSVR
jgi:pSer/pThr/pTyr-binding forkhead associated (FHA) protein